MFVSVFEFVVLTLKAITLPNHMQCYLLNCLLNILIVHSMWLVVWLGGTKRVYFLLSRRYAWTMEMRIWNRAVMESATPFSFYALSRSSLLSAKRGSCWHQFYKQVGCANTRLSRRWWKFRLRGALECAQPWAKEDVRDRSQWRRFEFALMLMSA